MKVPSIIDARSAIVNPVQTGSFSLRSKLVDSFNNPFGADTHFNLLVSSIYNQSDKEKRTWMKNSLPSKDLGMSILLTSITSSQFFESLRLEEINLVLSLTNVTNAWSRVVTDLHNPAMVSPSNALGLTNLCLGLSGIDDSNKDFVKKFLTTALSVTTAIAIERFKAEIAREKRRDMKQKTPRYDSFSYRNLRSGMSAVEEVNEKFISHFRSALLNFDIASFFNQQLSEGTFIVGTDEDKFFSCVESGVIGFVKTGDEYIELLKMYLLSVAVNVNVETKTLGYTTSEWESKLLDTFLTSTSIGNFVQNGVLNKPDNKENSVNLNMLWASLQSELTRNIAKNTSLSLLSIRETIRNITAFKHEFVKFIDDQAGFLTDSYKNGDMLFKAYKSFLISVKNATDVVSANELLLAFRGSKLFSSSMAGLMHGMCENRESIDASIVNDIAQIIIDEQVIAAFNRGPFKDIAKLRLIPAIVPDYGTGMRGMSYEVYYESDRSFTFDKSHSISFAAENPSTGLLASTTPWASPACLEEYCILGSMAINDPELRRVLAGGTEMTAFRQDLAPSRLIKDSLDPALRMLNNVMSTQMYIHYNASQAWYKQYLLGVWDYSSYFKNVFDLKESFLSHHPFRDKIQENLALFQDEIKSTLSSMFGITAEAPPANTLPVIKIEKEDGTITSEPQNIMNELMEILQRRAPFMHVMEDMRMVKRFMSRIGKEGTSFTRSNRINDMNSSVLATVGLFLKTHDLVAEPLSVRPSVEMVAPLASVDEAKQQMFRNFDTAQWLYLFDVDDTLSMLNTSSSRKNRNGSDRAKFGYHAEHHSFAPSFVFDLVRTLASERLVNYFQIDTFASLKYAKSIRNLSGVSQSIVKLAVDGREGLSVGLSPVPITFTSDSDAHTFYQVLSNLGLNEEMTVRLTDTAFFNAIIEGSSLGFPLRLTAQAQKKLSVLDPIKLKDKEYEVETIRLKDALALSSPFLMNKSVLRTFTIYLRDTKIINFMLNDVIMESFLDDYQLVQIKDDYIKALIGNESQDKFLSIEVKENLAIEDISNSARLPAMLRTVAEEVANFFFPMASIAKLSNDNPKDDQAEVVAEVETEDDEA